MAEPTKKAQVIDSFLTSLSGASRQGAIKTDRCITPPIGCGGEAVKFRDDVSKKEFTISGLCQNCQDDFYGRDDPDCEM